MLAMRLHSLAPISNGTSGNEHQVVSDLWLAQSQPEPCRVGKRRLGVHRRRGPPVLPDVLDEFALVAAQLVRRIIDRRSPGPHDNSMHRRKAARGAWPW